MIITAVNIIASGFASRLWPSVIGVSMVPLHTPDKHLICRWWCRSCQCSGTDSDQNATGQVWYGLGQQYIIFASCQSSWMVYVSLCCNCSLVSVY